MGKEPVACSGELAVLLLLLGAVVMPLLASRVGITKPTSVNRGASETLSGAIDEGKKPHGCPCLSHMQLHTVS